MPGKASTLITLAFLLGTASLAHAQSQPLSVNAERLREDALAAFGLTTPAEDAMIRFTGAPAVVETPTGIEMTLTNVILGPSDKSFSVALGTVKIVGAPAGDGFAEFTITGPAEIPVAGSDGKNVGKISLTDPSARTLWSEKVKASVGMTLGFAKAVGDFTIPADKPVVDPKVKPAKPAAPGKDGKAVITIGASDLKFDLKPVGERLWTGPLSAHLGATAIQDESNAKIIEIAGGSIDARYDGVDLQAYQTAAEALRGPMTKFSRAAGKADGKKPSPDADPTTLIPVVGTFLRNVIPAFGHQTANLRIDKLVVTPPPGSGDQSGRVTIDSLVETVDFSTRGAGSTTLNIGLGFTVAGLSIEKMPFVKLGSAGFDVKIDRFDPVALIDQFTKTPGADPNAAPSAPLAGIELALGAENTALPVDGAFVPFKKLSVALGLASIDQPTGAAWLTVEQSREPAPVTAPPATAAKIAAIPDATKIRFDLTSIPGIPALMTIAQSAATQDPNALIELLKSNGTEAQISDTAITWPDATISIIGKGAADDESKLGGTGDATIKVCGFDRLVDRVSNATGAKPQEAAQVRIMVKGMGKAEPTGCDKAGESMVYVVSLDEEGAVKVNDQDMGALMGNATPPDAPPPASQKGGTPKTSKPKTGN